MSVKGKLAGNAAPNAKGAAFPYLARLDRPLGDNAAGLVVFFLSPKTGVVVQEGLGYKVGTYQECWSDPEHWAKLPMGSVVTLEQAD